MIIQEINLYQERFKEKKLWLSFAHLMILTGLLVLALVYSSYWYNQQLQHAEQINNDFQIRKEHASQLLDSQKNQLNALLKNNQVDDEIAKISNSISAHKRIINFVSTNQFGSGKGFSSELYGLSEIKVDHVWLSEISLAEKNIKLTGSSLKAEKIPEYFNLFRQRRLFNGRVFEDFELSRKSAEDWKVDFLIASQVNVDE